MTSLPFISLLQALLVTTGGSHQWRGRCHVASAKSLYFLLFLLLLLLLLSLLHLIASYLQNFSYRQLEKSIAGYRIIATVQLEKSIARCRIIASQRKALLDIASQGKALLVIELQLVKEKHCWLLNYCQIEKSIASYSFIASQSISSYRIKASQRKALLDNIKLQLVRGKH